jgi:plastocyanin
MTHAIRPSSGTNRPRSRSATEYGGAARGFAKRVTFAGIIWVAFASLCDAGKLTVIVVDRSGRAVAEVVATAAAVPPKASAPAAEDATAIMDQHDLAFVPRVLVVAIGTKVEFPNSDSVSHQVYSFSPAKRFQLPLYKGALHPAVTFDKAGLVVLGCNIHDQMVGYIYVTDAPFFGKTDSQGALHLTTVPAGDYLVTLWSPFVADDPATLTRTVHVGERDPASTRVQLTRDLRARPEPRPRRTDWEY